MVDTGLGRRFGRLTLSAPERLRLSLVLPAHGDISVSPGIRKRPVRRPGGHPVLFTASHATSMDMVPGRGATSYVSRCGQAG